MAKRTYRMARPALLRQFDREKIIKAMGRRGQDPLFCANLTRKQQKKEKAMGHRGWQDPLFCANLLCSTLAGCSLGYSVVVLF
jgi:hypothetical protein